MSGPEDVTVFACGPSAKQCKCECPTGCCEHKWDGPEWESEDGLAGSTTCSRCGAARINHDMWVGP